MPKIKNILIFVVIAAIFIAIYFFYIRKSSDSDKNLVSTPATATTAGTAGATATGAPATTTGADSKIAQEFLSLLLSVKDIKLDDSIFLDQAFTSLDDSSITLTPDGTEGRVNPFAPLGTDAVMADNPPSN